jgi:hypothetical protein
VYPFPSLNVLPPWKAKEVPQDIERKGIATNSRNDNKLTIRVHKGMPDAGIRKKAVFGSG